MKDYDEKYSICLEKIKIINTKIENRLEKNNKKDLSDYSNTNNSIKELNSDLFSNIQILKSLSKYEELTYQEYTRRTTNIKKIEDQYNIFRKQIEENVKKFID